MSEMTAFFSRYAVRYMASDVDAISALYEAPLLAVREGRPTHLSDRAAVRDHLARLMAAYGSAGRPVPTLRRSTKCPWGSLEPW